MRNALALLAMIAATTAAAQTRITGSWVANDATSARRAEFTCTGAPTCNGVATVNLQPTQCSNGLSFTTAVTLTNVDVSRPNTSFSGTYSAQQRMCFAVQQNGTCVYTDGGAVAWPYTALWDGTRGSLNIASLRCDNSPLTRLGSFTANVANASPVFPMTVTSSLTPSVASASAVIQPRPQDAGRVVSVYVFAHAPLGTPGAALTKSEGASCVLAQLNSQGQLAPVSASSMTGTASAILSSQGQSVTILNNVATPNVAGATFFVGYGGSSAEMLANGVYQSALTIPGEAQCTASLAAAPAAAAPGPLTGLYWNASESGWGIHFTQRGANIFAAWYTYDGNGSAKWFVVPNCVGASASSGTCTGTLYEVSGSRFFGAAFDPLHVTSAASGTFQMRFDNANGGGMNYTVAGQSRFVQIVRAPLATGTIPPAVDYTDIWWNPSESGWGLAIAHQYSVAFLAWYVYDATGRPIWLVATCPMSGSSCSGTLYRTTGPGLGPTFDPTRVVATPAGIVAVNFSDANNGVVSYTVDGVSATKTITRNIF